MRSGDNTIFPLACFELLILIFIFWICHVRDFEQILFWNFLKKIYLLYMHSISSENIRLYMKKRSSISYIKLMLGVILKILVVNKFLVPQFFITTLLSSFDCYDGPGGLFIWSPHETISLYLHMKFVWTSQKFIANFIQASYEVHMNFFRISYEMKSNSFLWYSQEVHMNFVWSSNELLMNSIWNEIKFLHMNLHTVRMKFIWTSYRVILIKSTWAS